MVIAQNNIGISINTEVNPYTNAMLGTYEIAYYAMLVSTGISSATLSVSLAKNTLVRRFDVIVQAGRAQQTAVDRVAQVRAYSSSGDNKVVIDFGVPRTVSAINVPAGVDITEVSAWTGAAFGRPFFSEDSTGSHAVFASEIRSERLLVTLSKAIPSAELGEGMILELPEVPADLEIRINGAAPVWTNPGPVQPTTDSKLSTQNWNKDAKRIVRLTDALNFLLKDPLSNALGQYDITLTSKVPGVLDIVEATEVEHTRSFSYINRISFNNETDKILNFDEEGFIELPLPLLYTGNKNRRIEEISMTAIGNLPAERILPAIGPPPAATMDAPILAELVLDADHAACVRLSPDSGLAELTGIRLPLSAGDGGAEVTVVLWSNKDAAGMEPVVPMANGASEPVKLTAASSLGETWTRFVFTKPVTLDIANPPWLAVLVSRGTLTWALAGNPVVTTPSTPDDILVETAVLRRGAANGPWRSLPPPFQSAALMQARGRLRMIGTAAKTAPVAPLLMRVKDAGTAMISVTPGVKGVPVILTGNNVLNSTESGPVLMVVSRALGTVTLRAVDVVWRET